MVIATPPHFICLCGLSGAGKDTVGEHLAREHEFRRIAVADRLKEIVGELFDLEEEHLWGALRDVVHPRLGRTPRELYQRFGDACRELDPEIWIRGWIAAVARAREAGERVVCTDVRTEREIGAARAIGAAVWIVRRPGAGAPGAAGEHFTETRVVGLADAAFDRRIDNSWDLAHLRAQVDEALATFGATPLADPL
jgi:hypothetical protein